MNLKHVLSLFLVILVAGCVAQEEENKVSVKKLGGGEMNLEGKNVVMIIAPENFRDEELMEPKEVLENYGANVTIASKGTTSAKGKLGAIVSVDMDISEINVDDFDAVVFVGGSGASIYFDDERAREIATEAYEKGKVVAAICIAPSILANAGILEGKKVTSFPSEEKNLEAHGATYTGADVEVDGNIVTASGPHAASEFGEKIAELLSK